MDTFNHEFLDYIFDYQNQNIIFHYYKFGLLISSPVINVERYYEDGIKIHFKGGNTHVWAKNKIIKVRRPANLIRECEVCYSLHNEYNEHIGYVFS